MKEVYFVDYDRSDHVNSRGMCPGECYVENINFDKEFLGKGDKDFSIKYRKADAGLPREVDLLIANHPQIAKKDEIEELRDFYIANPRVNVVIVRNKDFPGLSRDAKYPNVFYSLLNDFKIRDIEDLLSR